jgi:hypothetical protein
MTRQRWMGALFAIGSACFFVAPFPGFAKLVGGHADELVFFIGSIFFTAGGALQSWLAWPQRKSSPAGRAAWQSSAIQSVGTVFFNVTTFMAINTSTASDQYNRLVWRPDALGSICFLISGAIAYYHSPRRGWLPARGEPGWWELGLNLLGCIFFGISAVAGYFVPSRGSVLDLAASNWNTCLGALCFLINGLAALTTGRTAKAGPFPRLHKLEVEVEIEADELI